MNNPEFVSLGTRCTSASIIGVLDVRKNSYPFDWIDQSIESILSLVKMPHSTDDEMNAYLDNYFNEIRSQRHPNGAWFPHDFVATDNPEQQLVEIKEKYLRRFKRLFDLFDSGKNIVFLTVFSEVNSTNVDAYNELITYLIHRIEGCPFFISVNLHDKYTSSKIANLTDDYTTNIRRVNFHVPFKNDWPMFDAEIIAAIQQNEITNTFFK